MRARGITKQPSTSKRRAACASLTRYREGLFSIVDPRKPFDAFMRDIFGGCFTEYAVVAGRQILGAIERQSRPETVAQATSGLINRFRRKVFKAMARNLCIELDEDDSRLTDHRSLYVAIILLQKQTLRMGQSF
jgi:hypothetical protein